MESGIKLELDNFLDGLVFALSEVFQGELLLLESSPLLNQVLGPEQRSQVLCPERRITTGLSRHVFTLQSRRAVVNGMQEKASAKLVLHRIRRALYLPCARLHSVTTSEGVTVLFRHRV